MIWSVGVWQGLSPLPWSRLFAAVLVNGAGDEGGQAAHEALDLIADLDDLAGLIDEPNHTVDLDSVQGAAPDGVKCFASELLKGASSGASAGRRVHRQVGIGAEELGQGLERDLRAEGLADGGLADLGDLQDVLMDLEPSGLQRFAGLEPVQQGFARDLRDLELALGPMVPGAMGDGHGEQVPVCMGGGIDVLDRGQQGGGLDDLGTGLHNGVPPFLS